MKFMTAIKKRMLFILSILTLISSNHVSAQECPDAVPAYFFFRPENEMLHYNKTLIPKLEPNGEIQVLVVFPGTQTSRYNFFCVVKIIKNDVISYQKTIGSNLDKTFTWEDLETKKFEEFFARVRKFTESALNVPIHQNRHLEKAGVPNNQCYIFCGPPLWFTVCSLFNPIKDTNCGKMWKEVSKYAGYDEWRN